MKNERNLPDILKKPIKFTVKNRNQLGSFDKSELAKLFQEVLEEEGLSKAIIKTGIQKLPDVPANSVYIQLDKEGYPIHPSEEGKFRQLNKIIGVDRWKTIFWVEAKNSYGILPGPDYELKAHIFLQKKGLFMVDFGMRMEHDIKHFKPKIYQASGVIVPRRVRLVVDTMLGYNHNPIVLDSHTIPDNAFDDIKKANEDYWEPPYFET